MSQAIQHPVVIYRAKLSELGRCTWSSISVCVFYKGQYYRILTNGDILDLVAHGAGTLLAVKSQWGVDAGGEGGAG